jgi:hypothetical protein
MNIRWKAGWPLVFVFAAMSAATAVSLRDHFGWEDSDAELALLAACGAAGLCAGALSLASKRRFSVALVDAVVGAALVVALIFLYYVVRMFTTADYS